MSESAEPKVWLIDGREYRVRKTPMATMQAYMHGPPSVGGTEPLDKIRHALGEMTIILRDKDGNAPTLAMLERDFDVDEIAEVRREYQRLGFDYESVVADLDKFLDQTLAKAAKDQPLWLRLRIAVLRRATKRWMRKAMKGL